MIVLLRGPQCLVKVHCHEDWDGIFGRAHASIGQVEGIVVAFDGGNVDVHEFDGLVGGIVDGMRVAHPNGRPDGSMQNRGAAINGELG